MTSLLAQAVSSGAYETLAPITGYINSSVPTRGAGALTEYLNGMFKLGIAVATGLAVIMVIIGGLQYMSTDAVGDKTEGREKIISALWGLLLALASWMILNTINPALVNPNLNVGTAEGVVNDVRPKIDQLNMPMRDGQPITFQNLTNQGFGGENMVVTGETLYPNLTAYSPQGGGNYVTLEGGYASSIAGLDGQAVVRTLDDYANGQSSYVTLAGDPNQYGQVYIIPSISYVNSLGQTVNLQNVVGYVHDTGSAFVNAGTSHFDVAIGRDYGQSMINIQPFGGTSTGIIPGRGR